jgi:hypothetical protein
MPRFLQHDLSHGIACYSAHPWRQAALNAAKDLKDLEDINDVKDTGRFGLFVARLLSKNRTPLDGRRAPASNT